MNWKLAYDARAISTWFSNYSFGSFTASHTCASKKILDTCTRRKEESQANFPCSSFDYKPPTIERLCANHSRASFCSTDSIKSAPTNSAQKILSRHQYNVKHQISKCVQNVYFPVRLLPRRNIPKNGRCCWMQCSKSHHRNMTTKG